MATIFGEPMGYRSVDIKRPPQNGEPFSAWAANNNPIMESGGHHIFASSLPYTGFFLLTSGQLSSAGITVPHWGYSYGYITQRNKEIATWVFHDNLESVSRMIAQEIEEIFPDPRIR